MRQEGRMIAMIVLARAGPIEVFTVARIVRRVEMMGERGNNF
jgi:hypothetical protein